MHYKYLFFLILTIVVGISPLAAQRTGDTYRFIAKRFEQKGSLDSSQLYYDSAFHQYTKQNHYASAALAYSSLEKHLIDSGFVDSTHYYMRTVYDATQNLSKYHTNLYVLNLKKSLASFYFRENMFDSTAGVLNNTLPFCIKKYGLESAQNASLSSMQSLVDFYNGDIASAESWMKTALKANDDKTKLGEMWIEYIEFNLLSENEDVLEELVLSTDNFAEKEVITAMYSTLFTYNQGNVAKAITQFADIDFSPDSTTSQAVILKYNLLKSVFLLEKGDYDESLLIAKEYLPIAQASYPEVHPIGAGYGTQLCKIYIEKSDFGAARDFIEKLVKSMENDLDNGHPLKAEAYFEYSRLLTSLEYFNQSKDKIDSAIVIKQGHSEEEGIFLGRCYNQKGVVSFHLNELDSAEIYLKRSLTILDNKLKKKQHIYLARVFNDLGRVYQLKEIDSNSIRNYIKSLEIYKTLLGKVHPHLGAGYYNVGSLYDKNEDYRKALSHYQTSLISNVFDFQDTSIVVNPTLDNALSDFILLRTLTGKVEALESYYGQSKNINHLTTALETYNLISNLVDKLRTGYVSNESKKFLNEKTSYLYERAIKLCVRLAKISQDEKYYESAFFFSERSRAGIMLSSIKDANAKKVAGLPDELLVKEKNLVLQIAAKEIEVFDELDKGNRSRQSTIDKLQNELFDLKNEYTDFISFLEQQYRSYYQLKYDNYSATIQDIQNTILNPIDKRDKKKYVLLEYFIGKDSLYIFQISKEKYSLIVNKKPDDFEKIVKGMRNSVIYNSKEHFVQTTTTLYNLLIPTSISKKMHFIIVPDGILSYVPFESLLDASTDKPLRKQEFLIRNSSISYSYSATLSVVLAQTPYEYESNSNSFTGFAPVFNNHNSFKIISSNKSDGVAFQNEEIISAPSMQDYAPLPNSESELENIFKKVNKRKFASNAYFYNSASKENLFKNSSLNSRFLHFATHGILDERNPNFSGIVLIDSVGTDILTLGEIYGFHANTEIVTLSACETGLGQLQGGEGLVSFSRGFFFAGAKFVIVSLWKVGDESSADVMVNFYKRYAKKKRQDIYKSFQKARVKIIKNKKYDKLSDWFPFLIIGTH